MGIKLVEHVLNHVPAGLTSGERLVLVVIAQDANEVTREGWPGMKLLAHRTGMKPESVQKVLRRLADRGIELRKPLGKDKNGTVIYAVNGSQTTYVVPRFAVSPDHSPPIKPRKGGPQSALRADHSPDKGGPQSDMGGPQSAPSLQAPLISPQQAAAAAIVIEHTDATEDEALTVVEAIRRDRPDIRNLVAVLRRYTAEEFAEQLQTIRGERHRGDVRNFLAWAATQPECIDFIPGGDLLRPDTDLPVCVACRNRKEADR